uniref:Uncharacterized protein n=1 Tax=Arundo donax TaxID=35708 RepID=A0A0A9DBU0_ARUDO
MQGVTSCTAFVWQYETYLTLPLNYSMKCQDNTI